MCEAATKLSHAATKGSHSDARPAAAASHDCSALQSVHYSGGQLAALGSIKRGRQQKFSQFGRIGEPTPTMSVKAREMDDAQNPCAGHHLNRAHAKITGPPASNKAPARAGVA